MKEAVLSIDLGTMGVKVSVVNFEGNIENQAYRSYPIINMEPNQAEQDPNLWVKSINECSIELSDKIPNLNNRIQAISLCGQMHTHVYLDSGGNLLGNAITWLDQRSSTIIKKWESEGINDKLFKYTWINPTATYTVPQLCWVRKNKKEMFKKTRHILLAKDYIKYLLTKKMVTDPSDASGTGVFDIIKNRWSSEAFELVDLPMNLFPCVQPSTAIIGNLTKEASSLFNLPPGVPVINGGSDHSVSEIGAGLFKEGRVSCILGTAGVVAGLTTKPIRDEKKRVTCWSYPLEGYWDILGITQTAASSLTWFRNAIERENSEEIFRIYSELAQNISPGSEGLIFLPYLMGERTPHWDPDAKGVFFGLKMKHNKAHMIRAIMEGVSYSIKESMDIIRELGVDTSDVTVMGGGSKSRVWNQILSDILGKKIGTLKTSDTGAIGNLILSALGINYFSNVDEAEKLIIRYDNYSPISENTKKYSSYFEIYKKIYQQTKDLMKRLKD
ncbi:xylulokinase [Petrotoga sp. DB-2]